VKEFPAFTFPPRSRPAPRTFRTRFLIRLLGVLLLASAAGAAEVEKYQQNPVQSLPSPAPKKGSVNIQFIGATKFSQSQLRAAIADQINAISESGLSPASADDTAFFLGVFYHRNGYSQADVRWEITNQGLVLKITEGPLTEVTAVTFSGNTLAATATMKGYLLGATQERFPRMKGNLPFVEEDVQTGIDRISALYLSEGFLHAVVKPAEIHYSNDKTSVTLRVEIHEGMRYRFGKLSFTGDLVFYPQKELMDQLTPFSTKPYTQDGVTNMQRTVVYFYKTNGYFLAKVTAEANPDTAADGVVPVNFHIESGNLFRFDGVSVTGLDRLHRNFLPKRFAKLKGKIYDPRKLNTEFEAMMRTGLFKKLTIDPRPLPSNEVELDMQAEEAKAKEIGFGIGYDTFEGAILALTLGDRDFLGSGRSLTSTFEYAQRFLRGQIVFSDPWFLESDYALQAKLYALTQQDLGYSKDETGFRAELKRQLTKKLDATVFLLVRQVSIQNDGMDPEVIGKSSYLVNSLGTTATYDLRDSKINPTKGLIFDATADVASSVLGSSLDFLRATYRFSYYVPITKKKTDQVENVTSMLAFGARGGFILPFQGQNEIPIDERFFNGGARSVRSFTEMELGPKESHHFPIGGDTFSTYNVEYTFPLYGDLQGAVFGDAGSVGQSLSRGAGELRYAIGGGVRYRLPIGPLRIDYGYNPDRKAEESIGAFQVTFGVAF